MPIDHDGREGQSIRRMPEPSRLSEPQERLRRVLPVPIAVVVLSGGGMASSKSCLAFSQSIVGHAFTVSSRNVSRAVALCRSNRSQCLTCPSASP